MATCTGHMGSHVDQMCDRLGVKVRKGKEMDDISHRQMNGADIQWNMKVWEKMGWFQPLPVGDVGRRWNKRSRDHKCALHEFVLNSSIWGTLEIHQRRCHIDRWLQEPGTQWAPGQRISCWAFCVSVVMATTFLWEKSNKNNVVQNKA